MILHECTHIHVSMTEDIVIVYTCLVQLASPSFTAHDITYVHTCI